MRDFGGQPIPLAGG